MNVGEGIRQVRKDKKLTLRKLAELTGFSHPYLSQIETGSLKKDPPPETLRKIAEALEIPASQLLRKAGYLTDDEVDEGQRIRLGGLERYLSNLTGIVMVTLLNKRKDEEFQKKMTESNSVLDTLDKHIGGLSPLLSSPYRDLYEDLFKKQKEPKEVAHIIMDDLDSAPGAFNVEMERLKNVVDPNTQVHPDGTESIYPLGTGYKEEVKTLSEAFGFNNWMSEVTHNERGENGLVSWKNYSFPINNIYHHLTDPLNHKYYRMFTLSLEDRKNIIELIDAYMLRKKINDNNKDFIIPALTKEPEVINEWEERRKRFQSTVPQDDIREE